MEPQVRFCTSADGTRIAYAAMGEGPPLVLVPGWPANLGLEWKHADVRAFYEGLSRHTTVIEFDQRGVGGSQREVGDVSLERRIDDLVALVDHLRLERFDLFGAHDGAWAAVAFAAQHPERVLRLVLWGPCVRGEDAAGPGPTRALVELIRERWSLARRALADIAFPRGPIELQRWWSNVLRQSAAPEVVARYLESSLRVDVEPLLSRVRAPTLVLHRTGDRSVPIDLVRAAAALMPDARFVALEGDIGHPMLGDVSYIETVIRFLDEGRGQPSAAQAPPAAGLVTILFTDIEGSTTLTQHLGDAKAQDLLRSHNTIVREALKAHGGSEIKHTGDGIMASFVSVSGALGCAIAIQRAVAARAEEHPDIPLRVRIGLNAGEPVAEDEDLFGTAVQLAARVCAQAQPGEILIPEGVRHLVAGKGFLFSDRGDVVLRGFEDPVRLYEVRWRGDA
jgi:class 3 adenylate cyclase/pimeloyl-ACP methyl ester carboxylesterase